MVGILQPYAKICTRMNCVMEFPLPNNRPRSEVSKGYVFTGIVTSTMGEGAGVTPNASWDTSHGQNRGGGCSEVNQPPPPPDRTTTPWTAAPLPLDRTTSPLDRTTTPAGQQKSTPWTTPPPPPSSGQNLPPGYIWELRSMGGRHASYWNAFLLFLF